MTQKEFQKDIYKQLRNLQASLVPVEYCSLPKIYGDIKKSTEKILLDLERLGLK